MSLGTTRPRVDDHGVASSANRFRERALSHRRRPWRRALLVALAAAVVAGLVWVVGWSTWLGVDRVEVTGVTGAEAQAVARLVEVPVGTPLARVDTEVVGARVRERVTVAEVSVRRSWPGTLTVEVVPRSAALVVRNPQGRLEVVDAEGVTFGTVPRPRPRGCRWSPRPATRAPPRRRCGRRWRCSRRCRSDLSRSVSGIRVSSANLVTFTLGSRTVVWGGGEDSARKVAILTALLRTKAKVIDVSAPDTPVTR